jgi:hypothetical protein
MNFKKDNLCPIHEECLIVNDEKRSKNEGIEIIVGLDRIIDIMTFAIDSFVDSIEGLLLEARYNVYKSIKSLDPEFPWDDPLKEKDEHDESIVSIDTEGIETENIETESTNTENIETQKEETENSETETATERKNKLYQVLKEALGALILL